MADNPAHHRKLWAFAQLSNKLSELVEFRSPDGRARDRSTEANSPIKYS
jgi:hypothetical protein